MRAGPSRAPVSHPSPDVRLHGLLGLAFRPRPHPVPPGVLPGRRRCLGAWVSRGLSVSGGRAGLHLRAGGAGSLRLWGRRGQEGGGGCTSASSPAPDPLPVPDVPVADAPCKRRREAPCVQGPSTSRRASSSPPWPSDAPPCGRAPCVSVTRPRMPGRGFVRTRVSVSPGRGTRGGRLGVRGAAGSRCPPRAPSALTRPPAAPLVAWPCRSPRPAPGPDLSALLAEKPSGTPEAHAWPRFCTGRTQRPLSVPRRPPCCRRPLRREARRGRGPRLQRLTTGSRGGLWARLAQDWEGEAGPGSLLPGSLGTVS